MFGLKQQHIEAINTCFTKLTQIEQVILYGSRAMGNYRTGSDIDLTIVGELDSRDFTELEIQLDDLMLPYKIDLSILIQIDNPELKDHIHRNGKVFYQKVDQFVLREPKGRSN